VTSVQTLHKITSINITSVATSKCALFRFSALFHEFFFLMAATEQDVQCTYNITFRCVRATIVAVEQQ